MQSGYQMAGLLGGAPAPIMSTALIHWAGGASWPVATYSAASAFITFVAVYLASKRERVAIFADFANKCCRHESFAGDVLVYDLDYVVELAKAYGNALITRDELQDELHSCSIKTIMYGVNIIDEDYGQDTAAAFVVAGELPISWERFFTRAELDADPKSSWLPEGCWCIDQGDERVKDFPPE